MKSNIHQRGVQYQKPFWVTHQIAVIAMYLMGIMFVLSDILCALYQMIVFTIEGIPKVPRRDYVIIDRGKLSKLNWKQKLGCVYCGYANGVQAWMKATANQTEVYFCAIKHSTPKKEQQHQKDFYEYKDFL